MSKKKTDEQFREEVEELTGDEYTFLECYKGAMVKIFCRHNKCGHEWTISPNNFLRGYGCPKCAGTMKKTNEEFVNEVKKLTGDEYTFLERYNGAANKILCRHNKCGYEWMALPHSFLNGCGCPKCAGTMKRTNEEFIEKVKKETNDEYIFKEKYQNSKTKLLCLHKICGYEWKISPDNFFHGTRCPKCATEKNAGKSTMTNNDFLSKVKNLTNDEYTFLQPYKKSNIAILCRHNVCNSEWYVRPYDFLGGHGCPYCANANKMKSDEVFQNEVLSLVGNEYSFLETYRGSDVKIKCRHNSCGHVWKITPNSFLGGKGCPECAHSAFLGEADIRAYLNEHNIAYVHDISIRELFVEHLGYSNGVYTDFMGKFVESINALDDKAGFGKMIDRFHISRARFDFYIFSDENKKKLAGLIEYDGRQHFKFIQYFFQSLKDFAYRHSADRVKDSFAEFFKIPLIRIAYFHKDQINAMLDDFFARPEYYRTQHNTYLTNEEYEACFDETDALADMKDFKFET